MFVPRTAPGEVVEAEVDLSQKPARGHLLRVVVASQARAEVPCGWAERCGGCALMHLTPVAQLEAHRAIVSSALMRALQASSSPGAELPTVAVHAAPTAVGYRTRARFAVVSGRGSPQIGYRRAESRVIESIASCLVLDPRLDAVLLQLKPLFAREQGEGEVSVALGNEGRPVLEVRWNRDLSGHFGEVAARVEQGLVRSSYLD